MHFFVQKRFWTKKYFGKRFCGNFFVRIHRYGQERVCHIYRLVTADSVESKQLIDNTVKEKVTDFMVQSKEFTENEMRGISNDIKIEEKRYIIDTKGDIEDIIAKANDLTKKFEESIQTGLPDRSALEEFEGVE